MSQEPITQADPELLPEEVRRDVQWLIRHLKREEQLVPLATAYVIINALIASQKRVRELEAELQAEYEAQAGASL